jgi:hypothetical protein
MDKDRIERYGTLKREPYPLHKKKGKSKSCFSEKWFLQLPFGVQGLFSCKTRCW